MDGVNYAALVANGQIVNHYQPIVDLRSGAVTGIEVLGRLTDGARIIPPAAFLPALGPTDLEDLLFDSLPKGLAALRACAGTHPALGISFNVAPSVMVRNGFQDRLLAVASLAGTDPRRITLELLEDDEFLNLDAARAQLARLGEAGFRLALDDVGTGYSSLVRMRELPVHSLKLDQGFVRDLGRHPENLQFVVAMQSLARGLRAELVIEGVETADILDALGVAGIGAAQGYAIARPMPEAALLEWLRAHKPRPAVREPRTLLAAYAAHLGIVEACRTTANQPLRVRWAEDVRDPHACAIGRFFDDHHLHDTEFGLAHKRFHALIDRHQDDPAAWEDAANTLWRTLQAAIRAGAVSDTRPTPGANGSAVAPKAREMLVAAEP